MDIRGEHLTRLLANNKKHIQLRAGRRLVAILSPAEALRRAESGTYIGVGSRRRVRYLCRAEQCAPIRPLAASFFTHRIRNEGGVLICPPMSVEHKRKCK